MHHDPDATRARDRGMMRGELIAAGLRPAVVNDSQIVLGELVSNATEHGRPDPDGNVEISWCVHDDRLRISVQIGGNVPELRALPFTDDSLRGRGLAMVGYPCENWELDNADGTRVTAELYYG